VEHVEALVEALVEAVVEAEVEAVVALVEAVEVVVEAVVAAEVVLVAVVAAEVEVEEVEEDLVEEDVFNRFIHLSICSILSLLVSHLDCSSISHILIIITNWNIKYTLYVHQILFYNTLIILKYSSFFILFSHFQHYSTRMYSYLFIPKI